MTGIRRFELVTAFFLVVLPTDVCARAAWQNSALENSCQAPPLHPIAAAKVIALRRSVKIVPIADNVDRSNNA